MGKEPRVGENLASFHQFVREERLFCALLAHLLWQRGPNLCNFLKLINDRLPEEQQIRSVRPEEAQVYVEFSYLRDHWNSLGRGNEAKRQRILTLLSRVASLGGCHLELLQWAIPDFNAFFMGRRGSRITRDIGYPGQWSVDALHERFGHDPQVFREFCKFKWAFNIKPDLVILLPSLKPLCIEAKLEGGEGSYPTNPTERGLFDEVFGQWKGRVGQIELQQFMFEDLLGSPCLSVLIGRDAPHTDAQSVFVSWDEVFGALDLGASHPSVRNLVSENRHLQMSKL